MENKFYASIEAGGTKFICSIVDLNHHVISQTKFDTAGPLTTFAQIEYFFDSFGANISKLSACGIASFGPLNLDINSPEHGTILETPKKEWIGVNIREEIEKVVKVPAAIDTDVNCAAMGEAKFGNGIGLERICYITVGTGIGVGLYDNLHRKTDSAHIEAGHVQVSKVEGDNFDGICPYHTNCVEGLASGPAMKARWNISAEHLSAEHIGWRYEANYIAQLCLNLTYTLRPQRIIIGGGVMEKEFLINMIKSEFSKLTNKYALDKYSSDVDNYIVKPKNISPSPAIVGAVEMAKQFLSLKG